jgi:hypothetical protein
LFINPGVFCWARELISTILGSGGCTSREMFSPESVEDLVDKRQDIAAEWRWHWLCLHCSKKRRQAHMTHGFARNTHWGNPARSRESPGNLLRSELGADAL